ncbi:sigma factor-like helix-turn-helix DNA-binding protein [Bradyrhizobium sp. LLZ17]|uniref:Sigma factor-like helix-turn-helix DNA-binding protein n=1 Tax=Bradyrhizobium sp. LLZ17 TaxID=3239388 RepID=A0AB39XG96_9BRAD
MPGIDSACRRASPLRSRTLRPIDLNFETRGTRHEICTADLIPDERLRLIFICCHPAVAPDSRAALTLRLVCGLTTNEIARAFLIEETALAQRLVRAKRKIADAAVPVRIAGAGTLGRASRGGHVDRRGRLFQSP